MRRLRVLARVNLLAPGLDDGGADNLHDVGGVGEVGAEGVAFFVTHRMLEEGAEDFRLHFGPVVIGGFAEQDEFLVVQLQPGRLGKEAAVEIGDVLEPAAVGGFAGVHGGEQAADEVVGVGGAVALVEEVGDEILFEQADVFGEEGHEHLQDEALGHGARHGRRAVGADQAFEAGGQRVGGFAGDGDAVVVEGGLVVAGEQEGERPPAGGQFGDGQRVHRGIHLRLEVIDAELVEVAEDDVARAVGDQAGPVVEGLAVVALEVHAAPLHFEQDDGFPDEIGKGGAAAVLGGLADAEFGLAADIEDARVAERLEQAVQEDLGLALFIAGDVLLRPADKLSQFFLTRHEGCSTGREGRVSVTKRPRQRHPKPREGE